MSWYPSDAWRDSYDNWKLATPPYYEEEPDEASLIEEDAWRDGTYISRADAIAIVGPSHPEWKPPFIEWTLIDEFDFEECFGVTA